MDDRQRCSTARLLDDVVSDVGEQRTIEGWVVALAGAGIPRYWSTDLVGASFRSLGRTTLWFPTESAASAAARAQLGHLTTGVRVQRLTDADLFRACHSAVR